MDWTQKVRQVNLRVSVQGHSFLEVIIENRKIFKKLKLAQEVYDKNFLNKRVSYIYENKNEIKKFLITFKKHFFYIWQV